MPLEFDMELSPHEKKIVDIVQNHPNVLTDPNERRVVAESYGLSEKTLRNRIAELKKRDVLNHEYPQKKTGKCLF